MGNCFSIQTSVENIILRGWDCMVGEASYICKLEENLQNLTLAVNELKELKADVQRKVDLAEQELLNPLNQVQGWLSRAEDILAQAEELLKDGTEEKNKLCLGGCLSQNCKATYKFGSKVAKSLKEVNEHKSKGNFDTIAETMPRALVAVRPTELPVGQESLFSMVWSIINDSDARTIGLYGLGGVGKTTLLTQINNKFSTTSSGFDIVIWVVVSRDHTVEKVQDKIGDEIGFSEGLWRNKSVDQKARDIFNVLNRKKFVLLFDDLWERVDLTKIGIPRPTQENGSKLVFTTRSLEVCCEMEAGKRIKVECLESEKAWELFLEKVGEETIKCHPDIEELAVEVVKQCGGLPLALITIGRAMTNKKTPEEWRYVIEMLKRSASPKFENEVYPLLKFSYDCLPATIRSCFLYCCLFPEDYNIYKKQLIEYWFCEGFLNEFERISEAQLQGYNIINFLLNACLLERTEEEEDYVKMHDVIRDMAIWIVSDLEATGEKFLVKAEVRLVKAPEVGRWEGTRRVSLMSNQLIDLGGTPKCPSLHTLLLNNNRLSTIRDGFFQHMPNIRVLDLSWNKGICEMPDGVGQLISLECLNLSKTSIRELPRKLKSLRNLKILDMSYMLDLIRIPRNVISSFSKLQIFRLSQDLGYGHYPGDEEDNVLNVGNEILIEELECLQHLSVLTIEIKSFVALERFLGRLQGCIEGLRLRKFTESKVFNVSSLKNMEHLERLDFLYCQSMEEIQIIPTKTCFHALSVVSLTGCEKLRDITWLILAPNLSFLTIFSCEKVEEIMEEEKLSAVADVVGNPNPTPFLKLQYLSLANLPELKSIYWNALPFPCLKEISVIADCFNLKKLPLNSDSAKGNKIRIFGPMKWWENLEWEDEATRNAFLPYFKLEEFD